MIILEGGGFNVVGLIIWGCLLLYTLFPDNVIFRTVIDWVAKIFFMGGSKQKW